MISKHQNHFKKNYVCTWEDGEIGNYCLNLPSKTHKEDTKYIIAKHR